MMILKILTSANTVAELVVTDIIEIDGIPFTTFTPLNPTPPPEELLSPITLSHSDRQSTDISLLVEIIHSLVVSPTIPSTSPDDA